MNPVQAAAARFEHKAYLEVVRGGADLPDKRIPLRFNPTELQLAKQNTFAEVPIPGLVAPPIQYVRGASEKLSFEALVDTSDTLEDVRRTYVDAIRGLMNVDRELHAPPVVRLVWNGPWDTPGQGRAHHEFVGVVESLNVTYTLFSAEGVPLRAKLSIALKEWTTVEDQVERFPTSSPDVEKAYVVRRNDTLSRIAEQAYGDPRQWRRIARANDLDEPGRLQAGTVLILPRVS
ncbi:MAG: LysM peptidoglycan-binding domain-containing protein [Kofleriaceae bacterium]|nr:LysM peptidoglycan-binding domain-containing protein [Myxococcales bacterium]MCB9563786.1 LysM peptidoglycan-binding domain-containing protein [Kofleriaceae bacterium]MCB9572651.1 LysM peptidoglycan-binding domain-containing protein [Kofleriaceae bacterium]